MSGENCDTCEHSRKVFSTMTGTYLHFLRCGHLRPYQWLTEHHKCVFTPRKWEKKLEQERPGEILGIENTK